MAYSDLLNKVESAFARIVSDAGTGVNVYTGQDDTPEQELPKAIVKAAQFSELFSIGMYGSYAGAVAVRVVTNADEYTLDQHRTLVAAIFDALSMDDLRETINSNEGAFSVIGIGQMLQEHGSEERTWFSEWGCALWCAPSEL